MEQQNRPGTGGMLYGYSLSPLGPSSLQDVYSGFCTHPYSETMGFRPLGIAWLIRPLHDDIPLSEILKKVI